MNDKSITQQGVVLAVAAYFMWSLAPIYFKALSGVSAFDILAHRVVWSFILIAVVIYILGKQSMVVRVVKDRNAMRGLLVSTLLIAANWGVFIWAVQDNRILSASLGYYINPLVSILLGMMFLSEKLDVPRKVAAGLCVFAVAFELIQFGRVPVVALFLACSFGLYGLVRKKIAVDSLTGLLIETALLTPIALVYLVLSPNDEARFINTSNFNIFLLLMAGPITTLPLLCFAAAANRISLTAMGFFQYIAPTGMFLLAVFVYGETMTLQKFTTFILIWIGLLLLVTDSARKFYSAKRLEPL